MSKTNYIKSKQKHSLFAAEEDYLTPIANQVYLAERIKHAHLIQNSWVQVMHPMYEKPICYYQVCVWAS